MESFKVDELEDITIKLDDLANNLFNDINNDFSFKTKYVIVPSIKVGSYLKTYYLRNFDGVLMNVKFITFNKALKELFYNGFKLASGTQIKSLIIKYLNINKNNIKNDKINNYLNSSNYEIKLVDLANEITNYINDLEIKNNLNKLDDYLLDLYKYIKDNLNQNKYKTKYQLYNDIYEYNDIIYIFGFNKYEEIEKLLLNKLKNKKEYKLINNYEINKSKINIVKAPSKIREIEYVHSKICELIIDEKASFSDFLVVGTNMADYEEVIERIFNQDNIKYPNIPYYINASKIKNNDVYSILKLLKEIMYKGFFTRLDFNNLITNNLFKEINNINEEDINNWANMITNLNVYYKEFEWNYAIKRLLINKIIDIDDEIELNNESYISYSSIGFNDDSIYKFISIIDDLNNIINVFNSNNLIDNNWLINFNTALDKFLSKKDENDVELNHNYIKLIDIFEYWKDTNIYDIPTKSFIEILLDLAKMSSLNEGELYTSGISFTEFEKNVVLSAKYVFFINASSANLPIKKIKNSLSNELINYKDEQNTFNLYYDNSTQFYVSFVYKDLIKDEEFFLSNFVKNLKDNNVIKYNELKNKNNFEDYLDAINIDEDAKIIKRIYTKRGQKNREFRKNLLNDDPLNVDNIADTGTQIIPTLVTTSQLANFLKEPLSSKADRLFDKSDDKASDLEIEYSPFNIGKLDEINIFKKMFIELFDASDINVVKEELKKYFNLRNQIPNITDTINESIFDKLFKSVNDLIKRIKDTLTDAKIKRLDDLSLNTLNKDWILTSNLDFVWATKDNINYYIPIKDKPSDKDMLHMYILSLMDVIKNDMDDVDIVLCSIDPDTKPFKINKDEAKDILNKIYERFIDYYDNYYLPYSIIKLSKETDDKKVKQYEELCSDYYKLVNDINNSWGYFNSNKLFNKDDELGYDIDYYKIDDQLDNNVVDSYELFKFLEVTSAEEDNNGNI